MEIYTQQEKLKNTISTYKKSGKSIGFVPTMGALHEGHLSLIYKSLSENDVTVVSIFVNPTQFNNAEDLDKYPRTLEADVEKIKKVSEEVIVYAPSVEDVYDKDVVSEKFNFEGLDKVMEGKFRPGHFDGVGTVVKKLFQIVTPDKAYFGEKDYQQLLIIKKMVAQTKLPVDVIGCPIVRDERGLALSSRNQRLSEDRREEAAYIYQVLQEVRNQFSTKNPIEIEKWVKQQFEIKKDFELEYFSIAEADTLTEIAEKESGKKYRAFVVVYVDGIRLIDNLEM
ncbi:pantoate--beta-alanine ligase [Capnocytophaga cynodegmi]|uniref:Pantothenate synthetase n=1 Tax=Capnocytophaga cynodegmi TaxID=28189 RepID=A0A0B7HAV9_9FLAO|nr:pantoate--beta-alanine ligase [Capnocytophaga cynodegmi]CEN35076.1 Pantothenate synthetase [Capnocytophaga cynodegmi]CEN35674.1 Pantothenate synthetase [Capnocytophaga cynodegmi]